VFVLTLLLAAGVGAYTLTKDTDARTAEPGESTSSLLRNQGEVDSSKGAAVPAPIGPRLRDDETLEGMLEDHDVLFLLLPGAGGGTALAMSERAEAVAARLRARRRSVAFLTLDPLSDEYAWLTRELSVASFPSVVVLGTEGEPVVLDSDVRELDLFRAYVLASASGGCATPCGK